jgi:2-phosphosulfolactate phosphatase
VSAGEPPGFTRQSGFELCFDWGESGLRALAATARSFVIVDVLSFTSCVTLACARGATIYPYPWKDVRVSAFAREQKAQLAGARGSGRYSLSPASLSAVAAGERLVLPSPNGSQLAFLAAEHGEVFAGSLRNPTALARRLARAPRPIAVIAAGERWPDGALRPCVEDCLGAGGLLMQLDGQASPEACLARAAFDSASRDLRGALRGCASGLELIQGGWEADVLLAAELDADPVAPLLRDEAFAAEPAP